MSLIICRNRPNDQLDVSDTSSIYEPYSFRNQLTSNIEVPANSQIALQSAKINMDGSVILGDDAKIFYIYFGPTIIGDEAPAKLDGQLRRMDQSPFIPLRVSLFPELNKLNKISVEDVASEVQKAVNRAITNPNLKNRFQCATELNADGSLKGFKFSFFEAITGGDAAYAPTSTIPRPFNFGAGNSGMLDASFTAHRLYQLTNGARGVAPAWTYTYNGAPLDDGVFAINGIRVRSRSVVGNVPPLNLKGGECKYNINGAINGIHSARFMVGLTRGCRGTYTLPLGRVMNQQRIRPPWYRHGNGSVDRPWMSAFVDYAVWFDHTTVSGANYQNRLVVGHTVVNTDDLGGQTGRVEGNAGRLKLQRIKYGDGTGGSEDTGTSNDIVTSAGFSNDYGYDLGNNPLSIEFVRFFVNGGQVEIKLESDVASGSNLYNLITYDANRKQAGLLKPINQNTECLLPVMVLNNNGNDPGAGAAQDLAIKTWDGNNLSSALYDMLSDDEEKNGFMDRIYSSDTSTTQRAKALDEERLYNDYTPSLIGNEVSIVKPYPGVHSGIGSVRQFTNIQHAWSVLPNNLYGGDNSMYVSKANTSVMLGFPNIPIVHNWTLTAEGDRTASSFSPPELLPSRSVFVRLENFGNESVNAFQGLKSKIIAHLPRFDGTNSIGPLYLEPNNLVYIDLKNPQPFKINSFDISLCYADETYATALQGTTIICLHLREKPK